MMQKTNIIALKRLKILIPVTIVISFLNFQGFDIFQKVFVFATISFLVPIFFEIYDNISNCNFRKNRKKIYNDVIEVFGNILDYSKKRARLNDGYTSCDILAFTGTTVFPLISERIMETIRDEIKLSLNIKLFVINPDILVNLYDAKANTF